MPTPLNQDTHRPIDKASTTLQIDAQPSSLYNVIAPRELYTSIASSKQSSTAINDLQGSTSQRKLFTTITSGIEHNRTKSKQLINNTRSLSVSSNILKSRQQRQPHPCFTIAATAFATNGVHEWPDVRGRE